MLPDIFKIMRNYVVKSKSRANSIKRAMEQTGINVHKERRRNYLERKHGGMNMFATVEPSITASDYLASLLFAKGKTVGINEKSDSQHIKKKVDNKRNNKEAKKDNSDDE